VDFFFFYTTEGDSFIVITALSIVIFLLLKTKNLGFMTVSSPLSDSSAFFLSSKDNKVVHMQHGSECIMHLIQYRIVIKIFFFQSLNLNMLVLY